MAEVQQTDRNSEGRVVQPDFSIAGGPFGSVHTPIHETLTLSALISAGYNVAAGTTLDNASNDAWEYIRGSVWNDDPACLLFNDSSSENHNYSSGLQWSYEFNTGETQWRKNDPQKMFNPTGRSHWGDLQFLHCMASTAGELPGETKGKFMIWLEVLWKLANGEDGITPATLIKDTALVKLCPNNSLPSNLSSLSYLLAGDSSFSGLNIQRRALGSMFHFIEDSYALGHTRRTLLNPQNQISDNPLQFQQGVADRWGAIQNFHVYDGQNDNLHSLYDHSDVSIPDANNLSNLDQFNGLIGCRDAVNQCISLIQLMQAGKTWDTGVSDFLDTEVFPISPNATPANTEVWP